MSAIVTIGIELAKNVFAVHGVDATDYPDGLRTFLRTRGPALSRRMGAVAA